MREIETQDEFEDMLAEASDKLVVVDFHAAWCGPCKMIGPKFEKMEPDFPDAVFVKVDVDENEETAEK
jgi:thioredoxin 1